MSLCKGGKKALAGRNGFGFAQGESESGNAEPTGRSVVQMLCAAMESVKSKTGSPGM